MSTQGNYPQKQIQTRQAAEEFLDSRVNLERIVSGRRGRMSLDSMRALCAALSHPENRFRSVHITGTIGKGSTSHYLSLLLSQHGAKVGLYTSPHLERLSERIQVDGKEISERDFIEIVGALSRLEESKSASYFDLLTAAAFKHFARSKVEWAVVEVGLGGRLDSTNVISPDLAIITNIGSDHSDVLGESAEEKAREKGGIIKPGIPVLCGVEDPKAHEVIQEICKQQKAKLYCYGKRFSVKEAKIQNRQLVAAIKTLKGEIKEVTLPTLAVYQAKNFAFALAAMDLLIEKFHLPNPDLTLTKSFAVQGRMEIFSGSPDFILDGAHMPEAIAALIESLKPFDLPRPRLAIFASATDKDFRGMLKLLSQWTDSVLVTAANTPRAVSVEELSVCAREFGMKVSVASDSREALQKSHEFAKGGTVLVTGSLYLVGELRTLLNQTS